MLDLCSTGNTSTSHSSKNGFQGCPSHVVKAKFFLPIAAIPSLIWRKLSWVSSTGHIVLDNICVSSNPSLGRPSLPCLLDGSTIVPSTSIDGSVGRQYRGPDVCLSLYAGAVCVCESRNVCSSLIALANEPARVEDPPLPDDAW